MIAYAYLAVAIVAEVIATTALRAADAFTRLWPSAISVAGYIIAFYFLSLTLRTMPVGIAYAIWSGVGIVLISLAGWLIYRQLLDLPVDFFLLRERLADHTDALPGRMIEKQPLDRTRITGEPRLHRGEPA